MNTPPPKEAYLQQMMESALKAADTAARQVAYHEPMSAVPREELDAKLQAIEARMDGRIASIEGKFALLFHRMDEMAAGISNLRWWILGAALTILIAAVGTGIGIQQMTLATFQAASQQAQPSQQPIIINVPSAAPQAPTK